MSNIDLNIARSFLNKMATDDDFRELFATNPKAALTQAGIPAQYHGCKKVTQLPNKATIASSLDVLALKLSYAQDSVHSLNIQLTRAEAEGV